MVSQPQSGFSLIELMITITIMTLLIVMGTSLTGYWVKQSEVDQAVMSMKSAIELSRATAIRNVAAQQDSAASSVVCLNETTKLITVHQATQDAEASCSTPHIFQYALVQAIEIQDAEHKPFKCLAFNHYGQLMASTAQCANSMFMSFQHGAVYETHHFNQ